MSISHDDIRNLLRLFDKSDWTEMRLEVDGLKLVVSNDPAFAGSSHAPAPAPVAAQAAISQSAAVTTTPSAAPVAAPAAAPALKDGQIPIRAPNLGTFWTQPKPGAPAYVQVGDLVDADSTVCLIEVMKLFTPVKALVKGRVAAICVEDGTMVEYDDLLLILDPA